ncbi:MAG: magnesium transporter [Candidatus Omnitrophica bacterium]|nr:magnesium transporter [Candidatus Omnitrophota bacterium]
MKNRELNIFALFLPEINELFSKKDFHQLKDLFKKIHSMDLADGWPSFQPHQKPIIFKLLGTRKSIEVFENLPFQEKSFLLNNLEGEEVSKVLNEMAPDERARLFKDLPQKVKKKFLSLMKNEVQEDVKALITYKRGTAGSLMTTDFVELKRDMTARKAILTLQEKQLAGQKASIYSVYVTDEQHKLLGGVNLQMLIMAPPDMLIRDLISEVSVISVKASSADEEVARLFAKYNLLDAPVVDDENRLLGVITIDDIVDVINRRTSKEIYEIGKMSSAEGRIISYERTNSMELVKRRAGWLIALLIFDFLTGTVLKTFEHALSSVVALSFFIPMLLDTGGNAGAQTSITIIRGLATGDVTFKNMWRIVKMELMAAIFMGTIVGLVAFARAYLLQQTFTLAIVVGFTMTFIVLLAILTGICLPLISKKVGLDPAVLAGPITTSIVDVVGLIIYFKIAQIIIPALRV